MWVLLIVLLFAGVSLAANDTCITVPQDPSCSSYSLSTERTTALVNALCGMHNMPGCTMQQLCLDKATRDSPFCPIFVTYKEICIDMPMMANCSTYKSMCATGSVVPQCSAEVVDLPSTMETRNLITSICSEMAMDGCELCADNQECDLLSVYSDLCLAMPGMLQCEAWHSMCSSIHDWPLCSSQSRSHPIPIMRMYFHTGFLDYILFKEWVPTNRGEYVGSWIGIFLIGIFFEFLKYFRSRMELKWRLTTKQLINKVNWDEVNPEDIKIFDFSTAKLNFRIDLARSVLHFSEYTLGLLLMLIAMTFNVGVFFAVCLGALVGNFIFGRYINYEAKPSCCS